MIYKEKGMLIEVFLKKKVRDVEDYERFILLAMLW